MATVDLLLATMRQRRAATAEARASAPKVDHPRPGVGSLDLLLAAVRRWRAQRQEARWEPPGWLADYYPEREPLPQGPSSAQRRTWEAVAAVAVVAAVGMIAVGATEAVRNEAAEGPAAVGRVRRPAPAPAPALAPAPTRKPAIEVTVGRGAPDPNVVSVFEQGTLRFTNVGPAPVAVESVTPHLFDTGDIQHGAWVDLKMTFGPGRFDYRITGWPGETGTIAVARR